MVLLGVILVLLAAAAGVVLIAGTAQLTDSVDIELLGGTLSLPPLTLLITGMVVISVFWLGWAMLRGGLRRAKRRRVEAKEAAAVDEARRREEAEEQKRLQEESAARERALVEERRLREQAEARAGENTTASDQPVATTDRVGDTDATRAGDATAGSAHARSDAGPGPGDRPA